MWLKRGGRLGGIAGCRAIGSRLPHGCWTLRRTDWFRRTHRSPHRTAPHPTGPDRTGLAGDHALSRALVFDFDGIILDTESADFESWRTLYAEWNVELPRERWLGAIGTDMSSFHPLDHLHEAIGGAVDVEEIRARRQRHLDAWNARLRPLPGVATWIEHARQLGMRVGIASSSPASWVDKYLKHAKLTDAFDTVVTADRVESVKPSPSLYLEALADLGASAEQSLALEDSPNGVAAAKAAGLFCIAVPGPMTRGLDLSAADLQLDSLAERDLASVVSLRDAAVARRTGC